MVTDRTLSDTARIPNSLYLLHISRIKSGDSGCKTIKIKKFYYFYKHCRMARLKLRCIMGCLGLKSSYWKNVLLKPNFKVHMNYRLLFCKQDGT